MFVTGVLYSGYVAFSEGLGIPVLGAVLFLGALQAFLLGVVSDQISAMRLSGFAPPSEND